MGGATTSWPFSAVWNALKSWHGPGQRDKSDRNTDKATNRSWQTRATWVPAGFQFIWGEVWRVSRIFATTWRRFLSPVDVTALDKVSQCYAVRPYSQKLQSGHMSPVNHGTVTKQCPATRSNLFECFEYQRKQRGTVSIYVHDREIL